MRALTANFPTTSSRVLRVLLCCLCFLGISIFIPVNAAMMIHGNAAPLSSSVTNHESMHASSQELQHPDTEAPCDGPACADPASCDAGCLHCTSCSASVASGVVTAPFAYRSGLSDPLQDSHIEVVLPGRTSPPFRPPIARD